ncbi:MAG: ParB/RepB/Spo0J family partition protein [Firmicutes bacterium]|jgi:ParB family chromosome partitioning protein|nr:ParB/RepB/Spo0J family partition protein [Bacillota bacterium]
MSKNIKRGLGKGLGALIQQETTSEAGVKYLEIDMIVPNRDQPRKYFDEDKLANLSDSISKHGVVQPILVQSHESGYKIIAGERRWRASKMAGLKEVPVIIKDIDPISVIEISLIENLQRHDLNHIEEAIAYKNLMEEYDYSHGDISKVIGKSRSHISNLIRLIELPEEIKNMIVDGDITSGHGRALLGIESDQVKMEFAERIIKDRLSVRDIERLVNKEKNKKKTIKSKDEDPVLLEIESSLHEVFGTKVSIKQGKSKGKIEIEYYGNDDLERIINMLKK